MKRSTLLQLEIEQARIRLHEIAKKYDGWNKKQSRLKNNRLCVTV
ncbi:hypothetical protein [Paenibacillus silvae]|nr:MULTISPECIES: hypothetical protein [Paenibacillus]